MTTLEALASPNLLLAIMAYLLVSLLVEWLGGRLLNRVSDVASTHWLAEHLLIPAARALALVAFILFAYPTLFGLAEAPRLAELLAAGRGRVTSLVNLSFALSLLLPLMPLIGRLPALVLPIQGMAAASLLFHWLVATQPAAWIDYWPDWATLGILLAMAFTGHALARQLSGSLATAGQKHYEKAGLEALIYRSILLALQAPVILFYGLSLGRQLP